MEASMDFYKGEDTWSIATHNTGDFVADIEPYYTKEHVKTDFYGDALNMECAEKAIKILNKGN